MPGSARSGSVNDLPVCLQWGPALYVCYKRAVAKANALVYEAGESGSTQLSEPESVGLKVHLVSL